MLVTGTINKTNVLIKTMVTDEQQNIMLLEVYIEHQTHWDFLNAALKQGEMLVVHGRGYALRKFFAYQTTMKRIGRAVHGVLSIAIIDKDYMPESKSNDSEDEMRSQDHFVVIAPESKLQARIYRRVYYPKKNYIPLYPYYDDNLTQVHVWQKEVNLLLREHGLLKHLVPVVGDLTGVEVQFKKDEWQKIISQAIRTNPVLAQVFGQVSLQGVSNEPIVIPLIDFFQQEYEVVQTVIKERLKLIHVPGMQTEFDIAARAALQELPRPPISMQQEIIIALTKKYLLSQQKTDLHIDGSAEVLGECGTGKTQMMICATYLLWRLGKVKRAICYVPSHLIGKWVKEWQAVMGEQVQVVDISEQPLRELMRLQAYWRSPGRFSVDAFPVQDGKLFVAVMSYSAGKFTYAWKPQVWTKKHIIWGEDPNGEWKKEVQYAYYCPACGMQTDAKVLKRNKAGKVLRKYQCEMCGEPLWQASIPKNYKSFEKYGVTKWLNILAKGERRVKVMRDRGKENIASALFKRCIERLGANRQGTETQKYMAMKFMNQYLKGFFQMLVLDESHKCGNESGLTAAYARGVQACKV